MNKEEMIEILKSLIVCGETHKTIMIGLQDIEAIQVAIEALQKISMLERLMETIKILDRQKKPCDDAISREMAIDAIFDSELYNDSYYYGIAYHILNGLPSVNPHPQISDEAYEKIYEKFKQALNNK